MTDKVQKIREEVEKIARSINPYIPDEEGKNSEYEAGRFAMVTQIMQIIDSMQEEPKKCMYTKDDYTDEDRKVPCDGCEEESEYAQKKDPVSDIDFEQELYKAFGQVKDFTLGIQIAKRFYEMGIQHQEHVSEDLNKIIEQQFYKYRLKIEKLRRLRDKQSPKFNEYKFGRAYGAFQTLGNLLGYIQNK